MVKCGPARGSIGLPSLDGLFDLKNGLFESRAFTSWRMSMCVKVIKVVVIGAYFFTPFCLPIWNSGMTHSTPVCWHLSQRGAPSSRRHFILLLRQVRQAACLLFMPRPLRVGAKRLKKLNVQQAASTRCRYARERACRGRQLFVSSLTYSAPAIVEALISWSRSPLSRARPHASV
jgi:hypothetical protein